MVKRCVYSGVLEPGQSQKPSWVIPSSPDAGALEQQCRDGGGNVQDDHIQDKCGSSSASVQQMSGPGPTANVVSDAVLGPVRRVRDILIQTHLVHALAQVNDSEIVLGIVKSNPDFAARLAEGVGFLSTVCTAVLASREDDPILNLTYDESLHGWIVGVADTLRAKLSDRNLLSNMDQAIGQLEAYVGRTFGDVSADLRKQVAATA